MRKKKIYDKPGRPKAKIDWKEVAEMLQAQSKVTEIAGCLGIDRETLYRRCQEDNNIGFVAFKEQNREKGKELLRQAQFKNALSGNSALQIWLGKQYLGQKDKKEINQTNTNKNIEIPLNDEAIELANELLEKLQNDK